MAVTLLPPEHADRLRAAPFTYPEVGQTAGRLPTGYRITHAVRTLPADTDLDTAARALLGWQVHRRAGFAVAASDRHLAPATVVQLSLAIGRLALIAPCRVVVAINEPHRSGFAYGSYPVTPSAVRNALCSIA